MAAINLTTLYENQTIDAIDWTFARTIVRLGGCDDPWVGLAAALVSRSASNGHVCLDLAAVSRQDPQTADLATAMLTSMSSGQLRERLQSCAAVGGPGDFCPLILDGSRLYLHRYFRYEQDLAKMILARCAPVALFDDEPRLNATLSQLFADPHSSQARAARLAATRRFGVISGGPGTGKTYTIAKIILLLQTLHQQSPLKISLAAPTGKAAARMQAAVEALLNEQDIAGAAQVGVQSAQTLHRLLGYMPSAAKFRYDAEHPLPADLVIVDEASMVDLALMYRLMIAIPPRGRLILVGDKDQLASVEAGAVLGDICHGVRPGNEPETIDADQKAGFAKAAPGAHLLAQHVAVLARSYRFDAEGGIGALSRSINAGDARKVLALLADERQSAIVLRPLSAWAAYAPQLEKEIMTAVGPLFDCDDPATAFALLNRFKILSAVRKGPFGVESMNILVEQILRRNGRIPLFPSSADGYPSRPVMITRNDYFHGLFNGDVGITMRTAAGGGDDLQVVFPDRDGGVKRLTPQQLPEHQTVYAMTIHKSQGSEFEDVMIVLPDEDSPLLTRELIYTAVTRARRSITLWAEPALLAKAVERPIERSSGLKDALWPSYWSAENNISR